MSLHPTQYKFRHYRADGGLVWASTLGDQDGSILKGSSADRDVIDAQDWISNALADEGEQNMLDSYFRAQNTPTNFFLRLWNDTPVETDTLALLTGEVTGTGYAAITLARNTTDFPTLALDSGDFKVTSLTKTFTAGGTWTSATYITLATVGSGTAGLLIAYSALSATRTLVNGDTLDVTFSLKLS